MLHGSIADCAMQYTRELTQSLRSSRFWRSGAMGVAPDLPASRTVVGEKTPGFQANFL
jgi:hypothetical protein